MVITVARYASAKGTAIHGQGVQPTVVGVAAPFDVAAVFQLIDVRDDAARQQPQLAAERLLTAPWFQRDRAQNAGVRRGEVDRRDQVGEDRRGAMAEL